MMHKKTKELHGKTIERITKSSINKWTITFTDGTRTDLWAEIDGPMNLGELWLETKKPKRKKKEITMKDIRIGHCYKLNYSGMIFLVSVSGFHHDPTLAWKDTDILSGFYGSFHRIFPDNTKGELFHNGSFYNLALSDIKRISKKEFSS